MKRLILSAALLAAAQLAAPFATHDGARAQGAGSAVTVAKTTIAGIQVIHKRVTANDVIAVQVYLKGGSAALTPDMQGVENLMGQSMTTGTDQYSKDQFAALSTSTGSSITAGTGYDFTTFGAQGVRQSFNDTWNLFTQALLHPTFPADEVAQVRDQLENTLKQRADDPDTYLEQLADSALYAGHPYALDPAGTAAAMAKLTRDDLVRWHKSRMTKENMLIVVVGNVAPADLRQKVTAAFGSLPARGGAAAKAEVVASAKGDPVLFKRELPTNYIEGVFTAPALSHQDFPAMRVTILVLTDRLFEEVRTKRNLTYATFAQVNNRVANRGRIYVTAANPDTTLKVMLGEVTRLHDEAVSTKLLTESVGVFATNYLMGQQTNMGQAGSLATWELTGGGYQNAASYVNRLRAVKPADVQRVARTYLKDFRFAVVGDPDKIDAALLKSK
ncbi:MAG: pitrilysin family protein [Gemmatimonadetes bacterium]|nr:pitrilysin family protein [Gemmatimonadota bacterium]